MAAARKLIDIIMSSPVAARWSATEGEKIRQLLNRAATALLLPTDKQPAELNAVSFELSQLPPHILRPLNESMQIMGDTLGRMTATNTAAVETDFIARIAAIKL